MARVVRTSLWASRPVSAAHCGRLARRVAGVALRLRSEHPGDGDDQWHDQPDHGRLHRQHPLTRPPLRPAFRTGQFSYAARGSVSRCSRHRPGLPFFTGSEAPSWRTGPLTCERECVAFRRSHRLRLLFSRRSRKGPHRSGPRAADPRLAATRSSTPLSWVVSTTGGASRETRLVGGPDLFVLILLRHLDGQCWIVRDHAAPPW